MSQSSSSANSLSSEQIDALWAVHDPGQGEARLKDALREYPGSADELRTQIARALGLQGRFEEAWQEVALISQSRAEIVEVRVLLESGRLKNSSGNSDESRDYFLRGLALAEQGHFDYYAIDAAHMLGIVSEGEESVRWNEKALQLAANSTEERARKWEGSLLNNLGWSYFRMGDFASALTRFESALEFQRGAGNAARVRIARWTVARCLRALQRYDEALTIQRELVQYPEQGYVSEELGELLLAMGRQDEAKPHFRRAYELLGESLGSEPRDGARLLRLKELSA